MKVLHVAETAKGGVRGYLEELVPHQLSVFGQHNVRVVLPADHMNGASTIPDDAIHAVQGDASRLVRTWRVLQATLQQLRCWQPDLVHLHSTFAGAALRPLLVARLDRPRIVYCAHGWAFDRAQRSPANVVIGAVERTLALCSDAIVCVSEHDRRRALGVGIGESRLVQINHGINDLTDDEAGVSAAAALWPPGKIKVLFVGRLDRQKGADILCEALAQLHDTHHAIVIGEGVVSRSGSALQLPPNAHCVGWIPRGEIDAYMRAADVVVMPSRWEAFGLVAIEAMRAGCAVVATRVGGLPEVVQHDVTGLLVPTDDAPALALALAQRSAPQLHALGAAGRKRFERLFRADRMLDRTQALYRSLVPASIAPNEEALPER